MKLAPSRDGMRLATLDRGRIRIVDLTGGAATCIESPNARDLVLFERELWVVDGQHLRVFGIDARERTSIALPSGTGLVRAPFGAAAAVWLSHRPLMIVEREGALEVEPLELDITHDDLVVPISAALALRARHDQVTLTGGGRQRWSQSVGTRTRVLALGPIFEGRAIAIATQAGDQQHLVVVDARDGRLQHRVGVRGVTAAHIAARRGLVALVSDDGQLVLVDLRFGRVVHQRREARAIDGVALDDAAQHLVLQFGDELVDLPVGELIAGRFGNGFDATEPARDVTTAAHAPDDATADEVPAVEPAPSFPPAPTPPAAPPGSDADSYEVGALVGLAPRPALAACATADARTLLDRYRQLVAALAGRAIAHGWDAGTIAFVDESRPPFEREVAALVHGTQGLAQPQLRTADEAVATAHRALRATIDELAGRLPPLARLARERGLTPLAQHILILVAAPSLWGELARLYGILANDEHRALCDEQLLVQLAGGADRHAIARELDRDRPLVRHGLIHIASDRGRPFAALSVDPLVLAILRDDPLDADLDAGIAVVPTGPSLDELRLPRPEVARALRALASTHPNGFARLVVRGRLGSGRRTTVAAIATRADRRVGTIDAARLVRERRIDQLATLLRRCALRGWLPLVDGLEGIGSDDAATRESVRDAVREHPGPVALRLPHDVEPPLAAGFVQLDLPPLSIGERADHWIASLHAAGIAVSEPDALSARFQVGPGVIARVTASVVAEGRATDPNRDPDAEIERAVRQHLASRLGQVATRAERLVNWSQVVLPPDIQDSILELIARIRHRRTVYDTWGFDGVMSTSRGVTALFQGGPGTGKTLVASAIANELGIDLYRVDLSRVMSKWIGETEQNLAKVFDAAEEGQAILLFDEADSLFAKRTEVRTSVDRYANLEVNYLLQRLDSFEGIAILTTNFGTSIDPAFKRRLSFRLTFPFPDDDTRELLWKAHLPEHLPRQGAFDLAELSRRYRMSGGYIRNAALRAAFIAAEEQTPVTQLHLERAIKAEFREIGKLADSGVLE
jgi:hypothetical protein